MCVLTGEREVGGPFTAAGRFAFAVAFGVGFGFGRAALVGGLLFGFALAGALLFGFLLAGALLFGGVFAAGFAFAGLPREQRQEDRGTPPAS